MRPTGLTDQNNTTDVSGVSYNAANQLLGITYFGKNETRTYNTLNQMTNVTIGTTMNITCTFPAGTNNGKVSSTTDALSGETVTYQYDSLNRLLSASSNKGWSEAYGFDGFGNLLSKTPTGGAPTLSQAVNATTNRIVGQNYDANGNQTSSATGTLTYDAENRVLTAASNGIQYAYDSRNKRVWSATIAGANMTQVLTYFGVDGQKLGTYTVSLGPGPAPQLGATVGTLAVFFGSKRVGLTQSGSTGAFTQDRLGSNGSYYPYGEAHGTVPQDQVGFATYTNDSATGLQYADQRYYASNWGRFMSVDPANAGGLVHPQSLNRYSYVLGDSINENDPRGLCAVIVAGITQSPNGNVAGMQDFAGITRAITAFPYARGSVPGGILNVLAQSAGFPTGATLTALEAIALAAQSPGPISIFAFSGGAAAFHLAFTMLKPEIQQRITSITYIDPGDPSPGSLEHGINATLTIATDNTSFISQLVQAGNNPNITADLIQTTGCGHDLNCVLNDYGYELADLAGAPCEIGAGSVFGAPSVRIPLLPTFTVDGFDVLLWQWLMLQPVPSVTSTITYSLPED